MARRRKSKRPSKAASARGGRKAARMMKRNSKGQFVRKKRR